MTLSTRAKTLWALVGALPVAAFFAWFGPTWQTVALTAAALTLLAIPHEGLHWLGHRLCGVRARLGSVKGALGLPTLAVQALEPQTLWSYRVAVALPAVILGCLPATLGALLGWQSLVLVGLVGLSMASSDIAVLTLTLGWSNRALVQDHPSEVGVWRIR